MVDLIAQGEHQKLEFKQGIPKDIVKSIVGMANASGGTILLGVSDSGDVVGVNASNKTVASVEDLATACDPRVVMNVTRLGECLAVDVSESTSKPVVCDWGYYQRRGSQTVEMLLREVQEMNLTYSPSTFEFRFCQDFSFCEDMSREAYDMWRKELPYELSQMEPQELLPKLSAAEMCDSQLLMTNAAVLMFASNPRQFISHCHITYLLFKDDRGTEILKREDLALPIPMLFDNVLDLLSRHMNTAYIPTKEAHDIEISEYPMLAVHEALINAVAHRNWDIGGANVFIELYSDKLCVKSPGGFPVGVTAENIAATCIRRNKLLADLMHRGNIIENAGSGVTRMREECEAHGTPPPVIEDIGHHVMVTFKPHPSAVRQ